MTYVSAHWYGTLPLWQSYWLNFIAGNMISSWVIAFIDSDLLLLLYVPFAIWQWVGLWRAANRALKETGKSLWPRLAQCHIVALVIYIQVSALLSSYDQGYAYGIEDAGYNLEEAT